MPTSAIDHINILTDDLEGTAAFYVGVLELTRIVAVRLEAAGFTGAWFCDAAGNAIVHVVWRDPLNNYGEGHIPGLPTNAVHHVAFRCEGFAATKARLTNLGVAMRINDRMHGLRQINVTDPKWHQRRDELSGRLNPCAMNSPRQTKTHYCRVASSA
ncbi:MAG: VOC family protein [Novosphingobium sp.]